MKRRLFLLLVTSFMLMGCTNTTNETSTKQDQSGTSENIDDSSSSSTKWSTDGGESTLKVDFYNNNSFPTGKILDHKEDFITAFNNGERSGDIGHRGFLSDISCNDKEKVAIANNTSDVCHINNILQLGTRTGAGELTLHFTGTPMVSVKIVAQAYWTCYQYSGTPLTYSVDEYANICVGNDENYIDLSNDGLAEPELITREYYFEHIFELKLYDVMNQDPLPDKQGQRVYIHSLEFKFGC